MRRRTRYLVAAGLAVGAALGIALALVVAMWVHNEFAADKKTLDLIEATRCPATRHGPVPLQGTRETVEAWLWSRDPQNGQNGASSRIFATETGHSVTRFVQATQWQSTQWPATPAAQATSVPRWVVDFVASLKTLETPLPADPAQGLGFSEQFFMVNEADNTPLGGVPYRLQTGGEPCKGTPFVVGRTETHGEHSGRTVRLYTAQPTRLTLLWDEPGVDDLTTLESGGWYGERVCFVDPEHRRPVPGYPYVVLAVSGEGQSIGQSAQSVAPSVGMAGTTDAFGCTAELFVPISPGTRETPETPGPAFRVYGGQDAVIMNPLGRPAKPTP